ncbi:MULTISPECIES: hypothetical protein [Nostocales]|uniref:Uncharacterized protein n=3 Tax=Nostocales TaxID=1161 RepID=A0A8S9TB32_9CYAN|nr:hypothetical protein [Tolypothrix bouteillei]KAF3888824.1 hypothetical protein DA73_0400027570 [Tolypothrix bouteillei VB521301]
MHAEQMLPSMNLSLDLLVYTSFMDVGYELLASDRVPLQIQQTFLRRIVYQYWNARELKTVGYRAAYLLQVAPEHWLFGWLYYNEWDSTSEHYIPYFICYYLAESLHALSIEKICACLQKGPVSLVERHTFSTSLEPLILEDLSSYQEVKPGVAIPWEVRQQIYRNFKQGQLTDLFILFQEIEKETELLQPVLLEDLVVEDRTTEDSTLPHVLPVPETDRELELLLPIPHEEWLAKDKTTNARALLPDRNFLLLLGISFGMFTSIIVIILFFVFFYTLRLIPIQHNPSPTPSVIPSNNLTFRS